MALPIKGGQRYCNTMGSIIRASSEVKVPFSPSALKSVLLQSRKTKYLFMNLKKCLKGGFRGSLGLEGVCLFVTEILQV